MSVFLSGYLYVNRGIDYDLPFREVIESACQFCDEVVVGTDPRFDDGTLDILSELESKLKPLKLLIREFDYDVENPHASIKNQVRQQCRGQWLLELDADKILARESGEIIIRKVSQSYESVYLLAIPILQFFNGNNIILNMPKLQDAVSRNIPAILHGGEERNGAGYVTLRRSPLSASLIIEGAEFYHYGWYCLPRRWEMKQTHHYYEGRRSGVYSSLEDYKYNLDGEPVDFWDIPWKRTIDHYRGAIIAETREANLKRFEGKHPELITRWLERQSERIIEPKHNIIHQIKNRIRRILR